MTIRKIAQGKYEVRVNYTLIPGKYKTITRKVTTYREARAAEKQIISTLASDNSDDNQKMTFAALVGKYVEDSKTRKRESTCVTNENIINHHIRNWFGDKIKVIDITPTIIRQWQNDLVTKGFKPTYLRTINSKLSAIFNFGIKYYGFLQNPVRAAGTIGKKNREGKLNFWTQKEFQLFVSGIKMENQNAMAYYVAFHILFYTGIREGELLALTPADIDFTNRTMQITKTFMVLHGKRVIQPPKTSSSNRTVTLPRFLADMIEKYIKTLPSQQGRLFPYLTKYNLTRKMKFVIDYTGVKMIRVHDLRHSAVAFMIHLGIPILEIAERCGHSSPNITYEVYAHLYPDRAQAVADRLNQAYVGTDPRAWRWKFTKKQISQKLQGIYLELQDVVTKNNLDAETAEKIQKIIAELITLEKKC